MSDPKKNRDALEKALDPRTRPVQLSLEEAEGQLSTAVYMATAIFERLEGHTISGNGHHARQAVAAFAVKELRERWIKREETKS